MSSYVPTGGGNDPNLWQTDPGYGQTGANRGAGYNPAFWEGRGGFDAYKASRRAYRAKFQEGGENYRKYMRVAQALGAGQPQSDADVLAILHQQGFDPVKEHGMSMVNNWLAEFHNAVNGMNQYDPSSGMKYNVATSDVNGRGPQPMSAEDWAYINRGFQGRIDDMLGANRFKEWVGSGQTGLHPDPATGLLTNGAGHYFDQSGWAVDPSTGQRTGRRYNGAGGMGGGFGGASLGQLAGISPLAPPPPPAPAQAAAAPGYAPAFSMPQMQAPAASPLSPPPAPTFADLMKTPKRPRRDGMFSAAYTPAGEPPYSGTGLLPDSSRMARYGRQGGLYGG